MSATWRLWGDWLIAAALCAVGQWEFWFTRPAHVGVVGHGVPTGLLFLPVALVLGRRRARPAICVAVATACFLTAGLFVTTRVDSGPVAFFIALIIGYYSAGAFGSSRADLGITIVAFGAVAMLDATRGVFDVNGPAQPIAWLVLAIAWVVGREIGRRRNDVAKLQDRAAELEKEREEKALAAVQEERTRIARELHDVVAHSVSVMVVQAQAGPRLVDDSPRATSTFQAIEHSGREALSELRRMLGILRTSDEHAAVQPQPGLDALHTLVEQVADAGLPVQCVIEGEPRPIPPGVDLSAYRIVQEALTNTLKHAGPARAQVILRYGSSALEIEVLDDGRGGAARVNGSGHGLIGMRERVGLYGGDLDAGPREQGGFAVRARLPLNGVGR